MLNRSKEEELRAANKRAKWFLFMIMSSFYIFLFYEEIIIIGVLLLIGGIIGVAVNYKSKEEIRKAREWDKITDSVINKLLSENDFNEGYIIERLKKQYKGTELYQLIEAHIRNQSIDQIIAALTAQINELPQLAVPLVEGYIDEWNKNIYNQNFWHIDTSVILDNFDYQASILLPEKGIAYNDYIVFCFFQIMILNFAYTAIDQPDMQRFMGIDI